MVNRIHKVLEEAGIKLSTVLSDVMGLSGQAILQALCEGERDPQPLVKLVHPSVRASRERIVTALTGEVRERHRFLLRELLFLISAQDRSIKHLEEEIERHLHPFEEQVKHCEKITGVSRHVVHVLMAEVETDLQRFPDAEHLSSWAGVCPGHKKSGGKRQSGKCKKGNRYVREALVQAAHGIRRSRTYLGEHYRRLKKRRGRKRAALAVGHNILVIYYHMMQTRQDYQERGLLLSQSKLTSWLLAQHSQLTHLNLFALLQRQGFLFHATWMFPTESAPETKCSSRDHCVTIRLQAHNQTRKISTIHKGITS